MTATPPSACPSSPAFVPRSALASQARRTQLRRMKIVALALLAAMISGFIISHAMGGQGAWAWVGVPGRIVDSRTCPIKQK